MKNKHIKELKKISSSINSYLYNANYDYCKRQKKTSVIDAFTFKLLQSKKDISGPKATYILNKFNNTKIVRSSFIARENQLDVSFYYNMYNMICNELHFLYKEIKDQQIVAVDATQINLRKNLSDNGLNLNKNGSSVNGFILGLYNVTYSTPISLKLLHDKNERNGFLNFINSTDHHNNKIYVFDRGYYSRNLVRILNNKNIKFVFRLKDNLKILPDVDDETVQLDNNSVRIVSYMINKMKYHLATNLLDSNQFPSKTLQDIYHKRWSIEEYFKHIKTNMNLNKINVKTFDEIQKSLYCTLIVNIIVDAICKINGPHLNNKMIINKAVLTEAVFSDFILRFMYNKKIGESVIREFINKAVQFQVSHKGESNPRESTIPYSKWYIKKYYHKYVTIGKKKYHSTMKRKQLGIS